MGEKFTTGRVMYALNKKQFFCVLFVLSVCYLLFELFFNHTRMISVDEFWFSHRIYQYKTGIPYKDFAPYKTILGYYLLLPTMFFTQDIMNTLYVMKDSLALFNVFFLALTCIALTRYFSYTAILAGLMLLLFSDTMLSYSTNIRVDLLGYWVALLAVLFILENDFIIAGLLLGLAFLITQKIIWYWAGMNIAFALHFFIFTKNKNTLIQLACFNAAALCVIVMYLIYWSIQTDWNTVSSSVFGEASAMYRLSWYDNSRSLFWRYIILYQPLLFLAAPLPLIALLTTYKGETHYQKRFIITVIATTLIVLLIPYKQVFPYYMQVLLPVFLLLYASFSEWLLGMFSKPVTFFISKEQFYAAILLHIFIITTVVFYLQLPFIYLTLNLLPTFICGMLMKPSSRTFFIPLFLSVTLIFGFMYPSVLLVQKLEKIDARYQKENMHNMLTLLSAGGDYVAGVEMIYGRDQPIPGLRHLMGPAIDYLEHPTRELWEVMLASLYEDPRANSNSVIRALDQSHVKLYLNNYRMHALPPIIKNDLNQHYAHFWGSIYLYAPLVNKYQPTFKIKFDGNYLIESDTANDIKIDGQIYHANDVLTLFAGQHISTSEMSYRLKLQPDTTGLILNVDNAKDSWEKVMF